MNDLTTLFCSVDDFWTSFEREWAKRLISSCKPRTGPAPTSLPYYLAPTGRRINKQLE